jgi:hypothetical protein
MFHRFVPCSTPATLVYISAMSVFVGRSLRSCCTSLRLLGVSFRNKETNSHIFTLAYVSRSHQVVWGDMKTTVYEHRLFQPALWKKQRQRSKPIEREGEHAIWTFLKLTSRPNRDSPRLPRELCGYRQLKVSQRPAGPPLGKPVLSVCLFICLSNSVYFYYLFLSLSIYLRIYLFTYPSIYASIYLCVCPPAS